MLLNILTILILHFNTIITRLDILVFFLCWIPPWKWPKKAETCSRFVSCMYIIASNYSEVTGTSMLSRLTAGTWLIVRTIRVRPADCDCTVHLELIQYRILWRGIFSGRIQIWRVWVRRGGAYRVLVGKPEGKRPLGRPRRRWVDNIRMDLQEVGCGYVDWIGLAQDRDRWRRLVSAVMNLRVP